MKQMPRRNKALTATLNRIVGRYGGETNEDDHIHADVGVIVVTTSATVAEMIEALAQRKEAVYVAMTNREAVRDAMRAADGTKVGVMNPDGDIVRPAEPQP
jgi:hypothetical protein